MKKITIAEIAMEIALTPEILKGIEKQMGLYAAIRAAMSTSVGGIGPLLRDRIIAQDELGVQVIGITLLYDKVWLQRWHFWGQFYLEKTDAAAYIRPLLKELDEELIVTMPDGSSVKVKVWEADYRKAKVYFLDAAQITSIVYPGSEDAPLEEDPVAWAGKMRRQQSWLVGRGALALLKMLNVQPDIVNLSETPTIFGLHFLVNDMLAKEKLFNKTKYIFNDHTPLEYAHPVWPESLMQEIKVKPKYYKKLESYQKDPQKIDVTQLIIDVASGVYGVAKRHGEVMRNMHTLRGYAEKIQTITNGVNRQIWQVDPLMDYDKLTDEQILQIKQQEREKLVDWMWHRFKLSSQWRDHKRNSPLVLWMRRVTEYKRLDILKTILSEQHFREHLFSLDITIFLGGRIHQNDMHSDRLVFELLDLIQKYPEAEKSLILLDNFNVWEAPRLYAGVDATVMISNAGREASATGFMKGQMNGAMTIATADGAIPESVFFYGKTPEGNVANGFQVEYDNGYPTPESFLKALTQFRQVYDNPQERAAMIRAALNQTPQVDVMRAVKESMELFKKL